VGFLPTFFPPEGRLGQTPVHAQPGPVDTLEEVIFEQASFPELQEDASLYPLLEAVMSRGAWAELGGVQGLPLATGAQHEEDGLQADAVILAGATAAEAMGVLVNGQQGLQLLPQNIRNAPRLGNRFGAHLLASCKAMPIQEL
jgi:hypothetical protein